MDEHNSNRPMSRISQLPVQVSVRVSRRSMTVDQFLEWTPGTIVSFDQSTASALELCVGQTIIGAGQAVKLDSKLGLRIQRIGAETAAEECATTSESSVR